MMSEVFSATLPHVVTSSFAANFLLMLSAGNLGGRLFWSYVSDVIGRRRTFLVFTAGAIPLYFCMPYVVSSVVITKSVVPLYGFCIATSLAVASMGGM
jgi:MFS family permease